ncbi:OLC1v1031228C1 [Oldenlandia corymbosa var. corymbosa]|uniref:mitogen-activated protein kinase kinase n=1 Tax=Oldenlandia corymbosa var. corymbosa TaxID=529605 RepID=A0AAV1CL73_OLDCO|nr:OLC1v1031228C1 [Oldenlandia corymbosa var. corymbosa]
MTLVREKRQKQSLRVTVPSISQANSWQRLQSSPPSSSSSSSSPGIDNLANFEKLAVLGHGNGGTVYKVCHRPTNVIYALKVLRFMEEPEMVQQRAFSEVEILRRVDSGFVVMCHGVFENGFSGADGIEDICFLLEYMEGGSLHDLLRKHPMLSENAISGIARSVLEGLHYLHSMQIVHSDIKPSNLLINRKGEVKIADFGVSRCIAGVDKEQCPSYMGTCAYMSPERIDPDRWDGVHSDGFAGDVWSLGVVVMECFVGHFPLIKPEEKPDWINLMCAICFEEKREMPETASAEIQSFVMRCLQRDWKIRGTVEELLVHPFVTKFEESAAEHLFYYASVM